MRLVTVTALLGGCVIEERLTLDLPVIAGGTGVTTLETADGGTVVLEEAVVRFADLRLEEPAQDVAGTLFRALSPISVAYAHPGHDYPGAVAGELLGEYEVDLLADDVELGVAPAYEGRFATGRVAIAGEVAVVAGTHTAPDGVVRPFRFAIGAEQEIVGIPFVERMSVTDPLAAVELRFDLADALSYVDWTAADTDGDGLLTEADDTYGNTVRFGVVATPTWSLVGVR